MTAAEPGGKSLRAAAEDQIYNDAGSTTTISFSLVEGGLSTGTDDGGNNVDADPQLSDADGPDNIDR